VGESSCGTAEETHPVLDVQVAEVGVCCELFLYSGVANLILGRFWRLIDERAHGSWRNSRREGDAGLTGGKLDCALEYTTGLRSWQRKQTSVGL